MTIEPEFSEACQIPQDMNIRTYANPIPISETSGKSWNQEHFAWTFPRPSMPSRKEKSRPSELQITVSRQDQRKLEEGQKPAHIWIRHSFRKIFQRPSIYLAIGIQAPFRHHYNPKTRDIRAEIKTSKDVKNRTILENYSKKETGPYAANPESKKIVKDDKPKRISKGDKTPSKTSFESEIFKKSKSKSEKNPEFKYSKLGSKTYSNKDMKNTMNSKKRDTESTYSRNNPKKDSKVILKKNSDGKSETCSINISNVDLIMYLEEIDTKFMDVNTWSKNYSQNNSKKDAKKEKKEGKKKGGKKGSDAESEDSKDAKKKDKKGGKKDKKKDSKKDTESTDAESEESKDAKKDDKKDKKSKKGDKKKNSKKDTESTDAESEESKDTKKDDKKDKKSKKGDKKKDSKKDAASTEESESEGDTKKGKKKGKKDAKKKKDAGSTDADSESEGDTKKGKKGEKKGKKDAKKKKGEESTESETDAEAIDGKKGSKKESKDAKKEIESTTDDSDKSLSKQDSKKITEDSDATSTDSRKAPTDLKRGGSRMSSKKTTFQEKEKQTITGRVPPTRERPPLPPCEPFLPSPKVKRVSQCKMPRPPPKQRYAPLKSPALQPPMQKSEPLGLSLQTPDSKPRSSSSGMAHKRLIRNTYQHLCRTPDCALFPRRSLGCYLSTAQDHHVLPPQHQTLRLWKQTNTILENLPHHLVVVVAIRLDHHLSWYLIANSSSLPSSINSAQWSPNTRTTLS
ncbi:cylicin-1 [Marmota marmota marmota]|uniref:cylicin-1 n=1 Tax=Marmota marmota marmota TaxID=9994 RepID=UPI0020931B29|nr:cylicin-1 [Marmota marmota marmota]